MPLPLQRRLTLAYGPDFSAPSSLCSVSNPACPCCASCPPLPVHAIKLVKNGPKTDASNLAATADSVYGPPVVGAKRLGSYALNSPLTSAAAFATVNSSGGKAPP